MREHGVVGIPSVVVEPGPGGTLGTGLCAILTGAITYRACDVVTLDTAVSPEAMLEQLAVLFRDRAPIPDQREFPELRPLLRSYEFPSSLLTDARLSVSLAHGRISSVLAVLAGRATQPAASSAGIELSYDCPRWEEGRITPGSADLVFSQAVMEYIDDLDSVYGEYMRMLKPGGIISHQIDFRSHGLAECWDGHWTYPDAAWKIVRGKRTAIISRRPHSEHIRAIRGAGFSVIADIREESPPAVPRERLSRRFREIPESDRRTCSTHIIAAKPGDPAARPPIS